MKRLIVFALIVWAPVVSAPQSASAGRCNYPDDLDARGHRCGGRAASVRPGGYEPPPENGSYESDGAERRSFSIPGSGTDYEPAIPGWVELTAKDPGAHINIRTAPAIDADSHSYGLVGDRVWATQTVQRDGYVWYFVGFPNSGATGWVRGDLVLVQ